MVDAVVKTGPQFYMGEDGVLMFKHVVDNTATIGPVPATAEHKETYPQALASYEAEGGEVPPEEPAEGGEEIEEEEAPPDETGKRTRRVRIPADWKDKDAASRKTLAGKIAGREVTTAAEADMIVRAEVEKREDRSWP